MLAVDGYDGWALFHLGEPGGEVGLVVAWCDLQVFDEAHHYVSGDVGDRELLAGDKRLLAELFLKRG